MNRYTLYIEYINITNCSVDQDNKGKIGKEKQDQQEEVSKIEESICTLFVSDIEVEKTTCFAKTTIMEGTIPVARCREMLGYNEVVMTAIRIVIFV